MSVVFLFVFLVLLLSVFVFRVVCLTLFVVRFCVVWGDLMGGLACVLTTTKEKEGF